MSKLQIYCVTDREIPFLEESDYKLAAVGKKKFSDKYLKCDFKDNIFHKEVNYSELTFHYWFWKNQLQNHREDEWIGFCQKRRFWLKSNTNLVSMDITHCLQKPSQKLDNGNISSGGYRELIPYMGKIAFALDVNGIFIEVHNNPEEAKCDGPTQWPLYKLEWLLDFFNK